MEVSLKGENAGKGIEFAPDWEFNLGTGIALTANTDRLALKMIFGRRIGRAPSGAK